MLGLNKLNEYFVLFVSCIGTQSSKWRLMREAFQGTRFLCYYYLSYSINSLFPGPPEAFQENASCIAEVSKEKPWLRTIKSTSKEKKVPATKSSKLVAVQAQTSTGQTFS